MPKCGGCKGPATHTGMAFPAGGSFPVTGCVSCLEELAKEMDVRVRHVDQPDETRGARSHCKVCPWVSFPWPTSDQAGCHATWHVFENHPDQWRSLFGDFAPSDPDPRKAA